MSAKGKSGGGKLAKRAAKRAASHRSAVLVDRALYGGGGALAVLTAIMVAYFMASETSGAGVKALSSSGDPEGVKDALFGGDPWVVLCSDSTFRAADSDDDAAGVHAGAKSLKLEERAAKVFRESAERDIKLGVKYATMGCAQALPGSKKNVYDRFKLDQGKSPVVFLAAGRDKPRQLNPALLTTRQTKQKSLSRTVRALVKRRFSLVKVATSNELKKSCAGRRACGLFIGYGTPSGALRSAWSHLAEKYRSLRWAWVDASKYSISLSKSLPRPKSDLDLRFVLFRRDTKRMYYAPYSDTFGSSDDAFMIKNEMESFISEATAYKEKELVDAPAFKTYSKFPALASKANKKAAKKKGTTAKAQNAAPKPKSAAKAKSFTSEPKEPAGPQMTQAEREMEIRRKLDEASERSKPQYVGEDADEAYSGEDADDDYYFEDDDIILLDDEYD